MCGGAPPTVRDPTPGSTPSPTWVTCWLPSRKRRKGCGGTPVTNCSDPLLCTRARSGGAARRPSIRTAATSWSNGGRCREKLREEGHDERLWVAAGLFRAATEVPASSPLVTGLRGACNRAGIPGDVRGMTAWVDACFLNESGTPAVCFGPGSIAQAHTADEWVSVSEVRMCARVLADFARRFLTGRESLSD